MNINDLKRLTTEDILGLEKRFRANLMNYMSGFKSANLIGTMDTTGHTNLAIFNSVVHIGATPPYLGFILRPLTVERHTFANIQAMQHYTINHIHTNIYRQAHQTAAKYDKTVSEFEAVGLTPMFTDLKAPYVQEAKLKLGLALQEVKEIECNKTLLVIGKVIELWLPKDSYDSAGHLDLSQLQEVAIGGLDTYYSTTKLERLAYAKP